MFDELLQLPVQATENSHYVSQGQGDLVILIHGSLCDMRYWRWQLRQLHPHCQLVALSLPGYWPNDPRLSSYQFGFEQHVAAVAEVVSAVRQPQQKLYVLGHSRGAHIATGYAHQYAEQINGLLLADPAFAPNTPQQPLTAINHAAQLLLQGNDSQALALFIDAVNGDTTWQQMVGWFRTMVEANAHTLIDQSREHLPTFSLTTLQALQHLPTIIINGEHSPRRYQQCSQALLRSLPHAQHTVINNAAHGMNLAKPKTFNQCVINFIKN